MCLRGAEVWARGYNGFHLGSIPIAMQHHVTASFRVKGAWILTRGRPLGVSSQRDWRGMGRSAISSVKEGLGQIFWTDTN
jgi:hypothetical protein